MSRAISVLALLSACDAREGSWQALRLNEVLPLDTVGVHGGPGPHPDWVELYNPTADPIVLAGLSLADDEERVLLPQDLVVPPFGVALVLADGTEGPDRVALRLDRHGESLHLLGPGGVAIHEVTWGPLLADHALAATPDGGDDWQIRVEPTPGEPNGGTASVGPASPCTPWIDGRTHLTEGDALSLTAGCQEPGDRDIRWYGRHPGEGAEIAVSTGLSDAGSHEVLVALESPGAAGVPATALVEVSVADAWADPANEPVQPDTYRSEWGLPVLHVDRAPEALTEEAQPAVVWLDGVRYDGTVKIRGATSAGYPKNNLTLELDPDQLELGPYGLSPKDHLVLVGNFDDNSHVRQRLVYDTWAAMAAFWGEARLTPRSHPVVLYLGGRYHGLYLALDRVDHELVREMGFEDGGELYKAVSHDANFYLHDANGAPKASLHAGFTWEDGPIAGDFGPLDALVGWTGSVSHEGFAAEVDDHLVRSEITDWHHLVRAFAAEDSAGKNAYLYRDPADGRFRYVPWDFNHAIGQTWTTHRQPPEAVDDLWPRNALFWHLREEPALAEAFWDRLDRMRDPGGPLSVGALLDRLDDYDAQLGQSPQRDWERWGDAYRAYPLWSGRTDWTTPAEERARVEQWLIARDGLVGAP